MDTEDKQIEHTKVNNNFNYIEVGGVIIQSHTESLEVVKKTVCELIDKYEDFLLARKKFNITTGTKR